jgi:hypothetical protein
MVADKHGAFGCGARQLAMRDNFDIKAFKYNAAPPMCNGKRGALFGKWQYKGNDEDAK